MELSGINSDKSGLSRPVEEIVRHQQDAIDDVVDFSGKPAAKRMKVRDVVRLNGAVTRVKFTTAFVDAEDYKVDLSPSRNYRRISGNEIEILSDTSDRATIDVAITKRVRRP